MTRSPGALAIRLRCRHLPGIRFEERSGDAFFGQDPAFFTNIHPNSRCLALIAEWETAALNGTLLTAVQGWRYTSARR